MNDVSEHLVEISRCQILASCLNSETPDHSLLPRGTGPVGRHLGRGADAPLASASPTPRGLARPSRPSTPAVRELEPIHRWIDQPRRTHRNQRAWPVLPIAGQGARSRSTHSTGTGLRPHGSRPLQITPRTRSARSDRDLLQPLPQQDTRTQRRARDRVPGPTRRSICPTATRTRRLRPCASASWTLRQNRRVSAPSKRPGTQNLRCPLLRRRHRGYAHHVAGLSNRGRRPMSDPLLSERVRTEHDPAVETDDVANRIRSGTFVETKISSTSRLEIRGQDGPSCLNL
jgi:hypothetical protein